MNAMPTTQDAARVVASMEAANQAHARIATRMGVTLPECYYKPRPVRNGLQTCRLLVIGCMHQDRAAPGPLSDDAALTQLALLEPRTARPVPLLDRIAGAIWRWF